LCINRLWRCGSGDVDFLCFDSAQCGWTNNPMFFRKHWFIDNLVTIYILKGEKLLLLNRIIINMIIVVITIHRHHRHLHYHHHYVHCLHHFKQIITILSYNYHDHDKQSSSSPAPSPCRSTCDVHISLWYYIIMIITYEALKNISVINIVNIHAQSYYFAFHN
jgi:hypothetical protein